MQIVITRPIKHLHQPLSNLLLTVSKMSFHFHQTYILYIFFQKCVRRLDLLKCDCDQILPQNRCSRLLYHSPAITPHNDNPWLPPIITAKTYTSRDINLLQILRNIVMQSVTQTNSKFTWRNLIILSLGLASFFSVGALLNSSAGSTLSQLLYLP